METLKEPLHASRRSRPLRGLVLQVFRKGHFENGFYDHHAVAERAWEAMRRGDAEGQAAKHFDIFEKWKREQKEETRGWRGIQPNTIIEFATRRRKGWIAPFAQEFYTRLSEAMRWLESKELIEYPKAEKVRKSSKFRRTSTPLPEKVED